MATLSSTSVNHPPSKDVKPAYLPSSTEITADSVEVPRGLEEQVRVADQVFSKMPRDV